MNPTAEDRRVYFQPGDLVRLLPDAALIRVGLSLLADITGRDWRALGDCLNYSTAQLDVFAAGHCRANPGYGLLRDWATKERSTVGALRATLERIERHDVIVILDDIVQNPIDLYVVIHDLAKHPLNAKIRGRLELWEGLIPCLEGHIQNRNEPKRYSLCQLSNSAWKWKQSCHSLKGQQIDIGITHEDTLSSTRSGSLEALIPQWHLVTPSILLFSRVTTAGNSNTTATLVQCSRDGDQSTAEHGNGHSPPVSTAAPTVRNQSAIASCSNFERNGATGCLLETLYLRSGSGYSDGPYPVQCTGDSLEPAGPLGISLRSEDGPAESSGRAQSSENAALTRNLRSPVESEDDATAVVDRTREMSTEGNRSPAAKSQHRCNGSIPETPVDSQHRHFEEEVSGENGANLAEITKRRVSYGLPSAEEIRQQFPELFYLPGFHPKLKHKLSLVRLAMKPYEQTNGRYLIRTYNSDDDSGIVHLALSVSHGGGLKHYQILSRRISTGRSYFLFNDDFEADTISHLIDHYKTHPLHPIGYRVDPAGSPTLVEPIANDESSNLTIDD